MTPTDHQPVRLRLLFFRMTRQTYVKAQAVTLAIFALLTLMGLATILWVGQWFPQVQLPAQQPLGPWLLRQFLVGLFWLGVLGLLGEILETVLVLRKFDRAELLERARHAAAPPLASEAVQIAPGAQPGPSPANQP
jgi:hypothetical protein